MDEDEQSRRLNDEVIFGTAQFAGNWQPKIWGHTRVEINSTRYVRTHLSADPGGFCSVHYHRERANRFIVLRGCLDIWILRGWELERVRLTDGNQFTVPSLVVHGFYAVSRCRAYEEYWADRHGEFSIDDIVRLTQGGRVHSPTSESGDETIRRLMREAVCHG